ncbi:winged helix-turn-helix domain-containing protein [Kordia sp.]|uniref:winged helix-turn-helix domain-containing protein n=1 Tax=Kordia sp. TaxID=1965332 RepID=UPI003B58BE0D
MLFTAIMSKKRLYLYIVLVIIALCTWFFSKRSKAETEFSEKVKISLRDVGNKLLLSEKDSTSLILPIKEISKYKYELSFQSQLVFEPNEMVTIIKNSFAQLKLPTTYLVEVIQCADEEVAYSYQMDEVEENTIIPCKNRSLPKNCYTIQVRFTERGAAFWNASSFIYIFLVIVFIAMEFFLFRKKPKEITTTKSDEQYAAIGSFHFYPTQNKLVKQATEINLSKKECELLQIFAANLNQVVTRDELTKKVWEDNGVIVGRSLDTYISKLRKKLKDDERIKITNVHGVGYKLELDS